MTKPHWSFWAICILALIWNALGCTNFVLQMNPENVAGLPDSYRSSIVERPIWATVGFAIAVFGSVVGCVLMLLRRALAYHVFVISLIGIVAVLGYTALAVLGTDSSSILIGTIMSLIVGVFLVWYASFAKRKNWIG